MIPQWVTDEVADGLAGLLALRLRNAPGEDLVEKTADIWEQAISQRVSCEQLDRLRIREGFRRIFPAVREWPAPFELLDKMPDRPKQERLPPPQVSEEEHQANAARVKEMVNGLIVKLYGPNMKLEGKNYERRN